MLIKFDVHKRYCFASIIDQEGQLVSEGLFHNMVDELDRFLMELEPEAKVVMDASTSGKNFSIGWQSRDLR